MRHPFQSLSSAWTPDGSNKLLFAACGSSIYSLDIKTWGVINRWSPKVSETKSFILKLLVSPDFKHLIASTAEDKAILTFLIHDSGELQLLSARHMPKRPCALSIDCDERHVLCGDKFGDVYCLPIVETELHAQNGTRKITVKPFKPSANELTVHTERNRRALRNQMVAQHSLSNEQDGLDFEHELVVGHVSMLTDIACAKIESSSGHTYSCIITADRDEHVRVTRARPQTHIIHGYCLGHKSFVGKLCVPSPHILISGGGDKELLMWDWYHGKLLGVVDLFGAMGTSQLPTLQRGSTAISGLWALRSGSNQVNAVCICEEVQVLFVIRARFVGDALSLQSTKVEELPLVGQPLDVTVCSDYLVISIDTTSLPKTENDTQISDRLAIYQITYDDGGEVLITKLHQRSSPPHDWLESVEENVARDQDMKQLHATFYSSSKLRKSHEDD